MNDSLTNGLKFNGRSQVRMLVGTWDENFLSNFLWWGFIFQYLYLKNFNPAYLYWKTCFPPDTGIANFFSELNLSCRGSSIIIGNISLWNYIISWSGLSHLLSTRFQLIYLYYEFINLWSTPIAFEKTIYLSELFFGIHPFLGHLPRSVGLSLNFLAQFWNTFFEKCYCRPYNFVFLWLIK